MSKRGTIDYSITTPNPDWKTVPVAIITSIDIGEKNFCTRVEKRSQDGSDIKTLFMERITINASNIYTYLFNYLESLFEKYINQSHLVVIERQLTKNKKCSRIMQHVITWCMSRLYFTLPFPQVIDINANLKYKLLGNPDVSHHTKKKKWGPQKAKELLEYRGDVVGLTIYQNEEKKDDVSDVVLQIEALYILHKLTPTPKIKTLPKFG